MSHLNLSLLGSFQAEISGEAVTAFPTDKVRALLTYLALEPNRVHRRESLGTLFWGEYENKVALRNLRLSLHRLRQTLDTISPGMSAKLFETSRQTIALNRDYLDLDVWQFESNLNSVEQHDHQDLTACENCLNQLGTAVNLYRGDLLMGLSVIDALEFEQWLTVERERLHQRQLEALEQLIEGHKQNGAFTTARDYAIQLLTLEPWREEIHRDVMRFYALEGQERGALAQFERSKEALAEELGVEPDEETLALLEQIQSGIFSQEVPTNLPTPITPFVGREQEIAEVMQLLGNPNCQLVSLIGPGGAGKTRLAIAAARHMLNNRRYHNGVFFVSLDKITSGEFLASTIADGLQLPLFGGRQPDDQLIDSLKNKSMLVVLDNYEHLITVDGGRALLRRILATHPEINFLITTRERLRLTGEWVLDVNGLNYPDISIITNNMSKDSNAMIAEYSAMELFTSSAKRIKNSFTLTVDDQIGVSQICQLVDGLPLALELAASWTRLLTPKEIVREIEDGFEVLTTSFEDVPERHQSILAVFDYSWQTLSEKAQTVFKALSIFRGGFDRDAAKEVVGASLTVLAELVNKSFLKVSSEGRYSIHELLRQYANEKLEMSMQAFEEVKDRHAAYYTNYIQKRQMPSRETLTQIGKEIGNIRPAWQWAVHRHRYEDLQKATFGMWAYLEANAAYIEGLEVFERAAQALNLEDNHAPRIATLGALYIREAWFRFRMGYFVESQIKSKKGRELLESLDSPTVAHELLIGRSIYIFTDLYLGDFAQVLDESQAILNAALPVNDFFNCRVAYNILGLQSQVLGDYEASFDYFKQGTEFSQKIGDIRSVVLNQVMFGALYLDLNQFEESRNLLEKGIKNARELQDPFSLNLGYAYLGNLDMKEGKLADAETHLRLALAEFEKIFDLYGICIAKIGVGNLLATNGDLEGSEREFLEGLRLTHSKEMMMFSISNLVGLAKARRQLGTLTDEEWFRWSTIARLHPSIQYDVKLDMIEAFPGEALDSNSSLIAEISADPKKAANDLIVEILS